MSTIDNTAATLPLPGGFADVASAGSFLTAIPSTTVKRVPLSPLRYPGGKTRFVPKLLGMPLHRDGYHRVIEPFAGGASVSLGLLNAGVADHAVLTDADPLISSFWIAATEQTEGLIDFMMSEPVTVERWQYWKSADEDTLDVLHKGMKALYLNRTTFSGLIRHGSVLGGLKQTGTTKIGARFNKPALAACLSRIGRWYDEGRIEAHHLDYRKALEVADPADLVYLDPPYVEKSDALYGPAFGESEHIALAECVGEMSADIHVIISYDDHPLIRKLYGGFGGMRFLTPEWAYGMGSGSGNTSSRELVITTLPE